MDARIKAYAKLNLTLDILGTSGDFHMLDSLVCSVDLFDLIKIHRRTDDKITIEMHGMGTELIEPEKNNAYLAAKKYQTRFNCGGADIKIFKNIPVGAGMGGSSANAAGVLRGMAKLYGAGSEAQLKELADELGSDTGYMLSGGFARISGRGERVQSLNVTKKLHFFALFPEGGVSTPKCYALYDKLAGTCHSAPDCHSAPNCHSERRAQPAAEESFCALQSNFPRKNQTQSAINALASGNLNALGGCLSNALTAPATHLNPHIAEAIEELKSFSPLGVSMTGSGSAVYALFESKELCEWAKSRYRGKHACLVLNSI
ncbi:MAG: 4-(cytidine 5'-diphospho)-2-C-methyl-D-erythritol kinase [Clostridia bacterium]|nr:4-(cytidine 5'-diphospho)-2-C-methyl-D-erythritol kinase [Clostridia bacterium]